MPAVVPDSESLDQSLDGFGCTVALDIDMKAFGTIRVVTMNEGARRKQRSSPSPKVTTFSITDINLPAKSLV